MTPVTVVIPLYNKELYVQRALQSVLDQTYKEFEILVIDDGSTDGGAKVVSAFGDSRIRLIQQANAGVSAARNRGIREASGELVAFLDADDEWMPDFLETIVLLRETFPQAGLYATGFRSIYKDRPSKDLALLCRKTMYLIHNYFTCALKEPFFCSSSFATPRTVFDTAGCFEEGESLEEDCDMWARIALGFPMAYAEKVLALYHHEAEGRAWFANSSYFPLPLFARRMRQFVIAAQIPNGDVTEVMKYCNHLLIKHAKRLIRAGLTAEARHVARQELFKVPGDSMEIFGVLLASYGVPMSWFRLTKRVIRRSLKIRSLIDASDPGTVDANHQKNQGRGSTPLDQ